MSERLNLEKRKWLEAHARAGSSQRDIAAVLRVAPSTVLRELVRNGGRDGYTAAKAQRRAAGQRVGVGPSRVSAAAWQAAIDQLRQGLSPEQIAAVAAPELAISASSIRRRLAADRRAGGRLFRYLRQRGKRRIPRAQRLKHQESSNIPARRSWRWRPLAAQLRSEAGHWEIDTIAGRGENRRAGALILVDRATRRQLLYPLPRFNARAVAQAAATVLRGEPVRSITADNGAEFAQHQRITEATGAPVFFADPGRPQQRGSCENAVARVRDLTRGWTFGNCSPRRLRTIAERLNNRPMKLHHWRTPNQAAQRL